MKIVDLLEGKDCPLATQDLKLNTKNRNSAIKAKHIQYGPLNLSDESYWDRLAKHWNTSAKVAKKSLCGNCAAFDVSPRMEKCMPGMVQKDGVLGYCHMHKFKCHSKRTCYTWAAGGPIKQDSVSYDWGKKEESVMKISDLINESYRLNSRYRKTLDGPRDIDPMGGEEEYERRVKILEESIATLSIKLYNVVENNLKDIKSYLNDIEEFGNVSRKDLEKIEDAVLNLYDAEKFDEIQKLIDKKLYNI